MTGQTVSSRTRSRRLTRQGPAALLLTSFVRAARPMVEQVYSTGSYPFGDDNLGTVWPIAGDYPDGNFEYYAGNVDIGSEPIEGLYFTIWLGNHLGGFEIPVDLVIEAALVYSADTSQYGDASVTYDGWHDISNTSTDGVFWGVSVADGPWTSGSPFLPGPRPVGALGLGLRGHYPAQDITLALREWKLTTVRLA